MSLFHHPEHAHTARNVNEIHSEQMTIGARIADAVANTIGSWNFIIIQAAIMAVWIVVNTLVVLFRFDSYPFVFLNLAMSAEAAFSAPVIMMSQNRQATKDRITAEETYRNAKKSEEETRSVMAHLSAQDTELLQQTTELLKQTAMLERHATSIERLIRRIDQATGRDAA